MVENNKNIKVEELAGSKILLHITVFPDEMKKFQDEALEKLGQELAVGGFRKGRAPLDILRDQIDKDKWLLEAVDVAVTQKYYDAVMEYKDKYITIASPKIDFTGKLDQSSLDDGFEFKAEVDVYPGVELPDYKKMVVEKKDIEVKKEDIEAAVEDLLKKRSTLNETLDGHEAKNGEWIDIDFDVFCDGTEIKNAGVKHFPLIIGNNSLIPGFEEKLIGIKRKEKRNFKIKIDSNFRDKSLAGQEVEFRVLVHEIKTVNKPEYDDDFVKSLKIDQVSDKKKLEDYIKGNLQKEKEARNKEEERNQILEKISEKTKIDIPESLIKQEYQLMWSELERNLAQRGVELEEYLQKENMDRNKVEDGWREQAIKRVQISLIIREIIKIEEIKVTAQAVESFIEQELSRIKESLSKSDSSQSGSLLKKYEQEYQKDENKVRIEQQLILDHMFDMLSGYMVK